MAKKKRQPPGAEEAFHKAQETAAKQGRSARAQKKARHVVERKLEQITRRGPSGKTEAFSEHYNKKNQEAFDTGAQQSFRIDTRPHNAPAKGPQQKASAPLGPGGQGGLNRPGGLSKGVTENRNAQYQLETVAVHAADIDRRLSKTIKDPNERHRLAAEMAIDKYVADNPQANLALDKVNINSIAKMVDEPKVRKLTDSEQGLAYPKKKSKVQQSLERRSQDVMDQYRERPKGKQPHGGLGKPIHDNRSAEPQEKLPFKSDDSWNKYGARATRKGTTSKPKALKPGQNVKKGKLSNQKFLGTLSSKESDWVNQQFEYGGAFHGARGNKVPGAYRRWQKYSNARQEGFEAPIAPTGETNAEHPTWQWLMADTRGRKPSTSTNKNREYKAMTDEGVKERFTGGVSKKSGTKVNNRFDSKIPSHEDFGVGIRVPGIPSERNLKQDNPDMSDREIFELRESYKQSVDEMLQNSRMAHENRQNTLLGKDKSETSASNKDRVVFFTTSTGYPAISVGANSLLGQYVIKKRKKMLYDQRMASRAEMKGEFPYATRDQHLVEVATGLTIGAQGRYGAFRHVGYRVGDKKSKGYGKMLPVGSQILRDSSGQPLYDRNGNLRYTEGYTRPFDLRPSNEVGLRIYLG